MIDRDTSEIPIQPKTLESIHGGIRGLRTVGKLQEDMRELPITFVQGVVSMGFGGTDSQQFVVAEIDPGSERKVIKDLYVFSDQEARAYRIVRPFNAEQQRVDNEYKQALAAWESIIGDMQEYEREMAIRTFQEACDATEEAFHLCRSIDRLYELGIIDAEERAEQLAAVSFDHNIPIANKNAVTPYEQIQLVLLPRMMLRKGVSLRLDQSADDEISALLTGMASQEGTHKIKFGEPQAWNMLGILDRAALEYPEALIDSNA